MYREEGCASGVNLGRTLGWEWKSELISSYGDRRGAPASTLAAGRYRSRQGARRHARPRPRRPPLQLDVAAAGAVEGGATGTGAAAGPV